MAEPPASPFVQRHQLVTVNGQTFTAYEPVESEVWVLVRVSDLGEGYDLISVHRTTQGGLPALVSAAADCGHGGPIRQDDADDYWIGSDRNDRVILWRWKVEG